MVDLMGLVIIILGVIVGNWIWELIEKRRGLRYKWTCPNCGNFSVSASHEDIINRAKEVHICDRKL